MIDRKNIVKTVFSAVDELNSLLPKNRQLEKKLDAVISGESGGLDSLGVINLIVATERKIEEKFKVLITLADERAMSQKEIPFRTISTFVDYVSLLLEEKKANA